MKSHIHFVLRRLINTRHYCYYFFAPKLKWLMQVLTWKLPRLAPGFLVYGSLWGCSEARIPAVCECARNFWPIIGFESEFCPFLMVESLLSEKNPDNVYNSASYMTLTIGCDRQKKREGRQSEREMEGWGTEMWIQKERRHTHSVERTCQSARREVWFPRAGR